MFSLSNIISLSIYPPPSLSIYIFESLSLMYICPQEVGGIIWNMESLMHTYGFRFAKSVHLQIVQIHRANKLSTQYPTNKQTRPHTNTHTPQIHKSTLKHILTQTVKAHMDITHINSQLTHTYTTDKHTIHRHTV